MERSGNTINRFNKYVRKTHSCWIWEGAILKSGYGQFRFESKNWRVHRFMWKYICKKELPKGLDLCHRCDIRTCVYPNHLFLGTRKNNMQDAMNKKRVHFGESHPTAKLTKKHIELIRENPTKTISWYTQIAKKFNVHPFTIYRIVANKSRIHG